MKKTIKNFIITVASLTALLLLFSCAMENNELKTADLEISVQSLNSKTLTPEGGLDSTKITKYKLNGVGPRGATFDWMESSDGKFKVTGIIQGAWTLSAEGYTANNTEIAIGKTVVNLSAGNTKAIVVLNELVGKGTANITVTWDTSMASDKAFVEMRVKPVGGAYATKTFKSQTNGNAVYNELLDAGSYIVNALLYEDNTKTKLIAGTADAMKIVDNKITNGNLALVIGNIATDYDFTLNDQTMAPIEGTLTTVVADPDAEHKSVVNATYTLSQDTLTIMNGLGVKTSDINVEWFLDGVSVTDENTADDKFEGTFTVTAGERNLGIVLTSARLGSSGNSNIIVNAIYEKEKLGETFKVEKGKTINSPTEVLNNIEPAVSNSIIVGFQKNDGSKAIAEEITFPYTNDTQEDVTISPICVNMNDLCIIKNGTVTGFKDIIKNYTMFCIPDSNKEIKNIDISEAFVGSLTEQNPNLDHFMSMIKYIRLSSSLNSFFIAKNISLPNNIPINIPFTYLLGTILQISKNNPYLKEKDNMILSGDETVLYSVLKGLKGSTFRVPSSIKKIEDVAFFIPLGASWPTTFFEKVIIPSSVEYIGSYAFAMYPSSLTGNNDYTSLIFESGKIPNTFNKYWDSQMLAKVCNTNGENILPVGNYSYKINGDKIIISYTFNDYGWDKLANRSNGKDSVKMNFQHDINDDITVDYESFSFDSITKTYSTELIAKNNGNHKISCTIDIGLYQQGTAVVDSTVINFTTSI